MGSKMSAPFKMADAPSAFSLTIGFNANLVSNHSNGSNWVIG